MSIQTKKHPFSVEEDLEILQFVQVHGTKNWRLIASQLNRSPKQCRERWNGHLNPTINKGPWSFEEDLILAQKQNELGNKWAQISKFLPGRTDTIVKNRWNTSVKNRIHELLYSNHISSLGGSDKDFRVSDWLLNFNEQKSKFIPSLVSIDSLPPLVSTEKK